MAKRWRLPGLQGWIRGLNPGYFAMVMATGIVSRAMSLDGAHSIAGILLGVTIVAYLSLLAAYIWRLARYRREFFADARDPAKAFAFMTFVAASDVLGTRLASGGHKAVTAMLLAVGLAGWLVIGYGVPLLLVTAGGASKAGAKANGTWFIWVVATQSVAVVATSLGPAIPVGLAALALACWAIGVVLYVIIAAIVLATLLLREVAPADITPPYWVLMGATAISVLAGAQILGLHGGAQDRAVRDLVSGVSFLLWAFGSWVVPLLVALGVWRHVLRRVSLSYEPGLWSVVFPVGMYGVASRAFGAAIGQGWLVTLGSDEAWLALAAWLAVFLAMISSLREWSARLLP